MRVSQLRLTDWKSFRDSGYLNLGQINILVGRNNSGKSALLRSLMMMQASTVPINNVRLGAETANIEVGLTGDALSFDLHHYFKTPQMNHDSVILQLRLTNSRRPDTGPLASPQRSINVIESSDLHHIEPQEPHNFIYPYFSKRKVAEFNQQVDKASAHAVAENLSNLVAKIDRLTSPDYIQAAEYAELCQSVLGFRIGTYAADRGKQAGISIGKYEHIPLEEMGEGVSSLLGLVTALCMADGHLFLIEEPENDVHPESLKKLLSAIIDKSESNQFVVTTHSNIVVRHLGAAPKSKLFVVESDFDDVGMPTSTVREIGADSDSRIAVLRDLGYELSDFYLWDGWLVLEESSAQTIIQYLIEWFVPKLSRLRIVSADGVNNVEPMLKEYRRLFLFAHLEPQYRDRAWAIVDGDPAGKKVVEGLKSRFKDWPGDRFQALDEENFEGYFPPLFDQEVTHALTLTGADKRTAKRVLVERVDAWCRDDPDNAKMAFSESAAEVIERLQGIADSLP